MKRTLTSIFTSILLGFLLIGVISIVQNVAQDIQKTFFHKADKSHLLSYE